MRKTFSEWKPVFYTVVVLALIAIVCQMALSQGFGPPQGQPHGRSGGQGQDRPAPPDPTSRLNHALTDAGAPALSSDQQAQIQALFETLHQAMEANKPDQSTQSLHQAYESAIQAGDLAAAQADAATIASQMAATQAANMKAEAAFAVGLVNVLKSNPSQIQALQQRMGADG